MEQGAAAVLEVACRGPSAFSSSFTKLVSPSSGVSRPSSCSSLPPSSLSFAITAENPTVSSLINKTDAFSSFWDECVWAASPRLLSERLEGCGPVAVIRV